MIDWRNPASLENLSTAQALQVLGAISESLANPQTIETQDHSRFDALSVSPEAAEFAAAARRFHRRAQAAQDCRPQLRQVADAKRETLTPAEDAAEYAEGMKKFHRK